MIGQTNFWQQKKIRETFTASLVHVIASSFFEEIFLDVITAVCSQDSQTRTVLRVASLDNVAMPDSLLPTPDVSHAGLQSNYGREEGSIPQQGNPVKGQICCLIMFVVFRISTFKSVSFPNSRAASFRRLRIKKNGHSLILRFMELKLTRLH